MPILGTQMRALALTATLVGLLSLPLAASAAERPTPPVPPGSLSVEQGRGAVTIRGEGGVLGKLDGVLQIVDLTPRDRWSPIVNGVVVKRPAVRLRGEAISFRLLGGRFKIMLKGQRISISARGHGVAVLKAEADLQGYAGLYTTDANADCVALPETCLPLPDDGLRVPFGLPATLDGMQEKADPREKTAATDRSR